MTYQIQDLTGNPMVEEQIRQYYIKKKAREEQNKVVFTEGVATRPRERVEFTIDNSYMYDITADEKELYNRNMNKAWEKHYKADKVRRKYEELQKQEYAG